MCQKVANMHFRGYLTDNSNIKCSSINIFKNKFRKNIAISFSLYFINNKKENILIEFFMISTDLHTLRVKNKKYYIAKCLSMRRVSSLCHQNVRFLL